MNSRMIRRLREVLQELEEEYKDGTAAVSELAPLAESKNNPTLNPQAPTARWRSDSVAWFVLASNSYGMASSKFATWLTWPNTVSSCSISGGENGTDPVCVIEIGTPMCPSVWMIAFRVFQYCHYNRIARISL